MLQLPPGVAVSDQQPAPARNHSPMPDHHHQRQSPQPSPMSSSSGSSFHFQHARSHSQTHALSPSSRQSASPGSFQPIRHDRPPSSWTQLIPPMPNPSPSAPPAANPPMDEFDFGTTPSPPPTRASHRHSMAISPIAPTISATDDPLAPSEAHTRKPVSQPYGFQFYTTPADRGPAGPRPPQAAAAPPPTARPRQHSNPNPKIHIHKPTSSSSVPTTSSTTTTTNNTQSSWSERSTPGPDVSAASSSDTSRDLSREATKDSTPRPRAPPLVQQTSSSVIPQLLPPTQTTTAPSAPNNTLSTNTTNNPSRRRSVRKKSRKVCHACKGEITGQFVRALNLPFHVDCFCCHQCNKPCSAKFFPYELSPGDESSLVALCEYDYFKRLDLICFTCNKALRGPYITALGNKYHLEHFKCAVCHKVFEADESYYEHDNNIYCHFHYSRQFAAKCEGCHSSIVKQFVELYRGGRNQQWHPECYMVHKFWNVSIETDQVGLKQKYGILHPQQVLNDLKQGNAGDDDPKLLYAIESQIEIVVMQCWLTLSGYEEATAANISDMLLNAHISNQAQGILATGKLILNVEILFKAMDRVLALQQSERVQQTIEPPSDSEDDHVPFQQLRKEPRNISGKIMSYLAILRKSVHISQSGTLSTELLSVITGCAHYLKLLIRTGLYNALAVNRMLGSTEAIDAFLGVMRSHEQLSDDVGDRVNSPVDDSKLSFIAQKLAVPPNSTDACTSCQKSIEKSCIRHREHNKRWHPQCFNCGNCHRPIPSSEYAQAGYDTAASVALCRNCVEEHTGGFDRVTDLEQLVYLLKIALARSRAAMKVNFGGIAAEQQRVLRQLSVSKHGDEAVEGYTKTLDDVTRLRARRQSHKLSGSIKQNARRSVIVEAPEADKAKRDQDDELSVSELGQRKVSQTSLLSYNALTPEDDQFNLKGKPVLKIREEEGTHQAHLDRTTDMLKNEKSLTLDDIPRIVAAEQAREQRPNAYKHHNSLYQRSKPLKPVRAHSGKDQINPTSHLNEILGQESEPAVPEAPVTKKRTYYSELSKEEHWVMRHIAIEAFCHSFGTSRDELLPIIQTKKPQTFWEKLRFGAEKTPKDQGVFAVELVDLTKKYGTDSDLGVGPCKLRIPIFVDDVISALKQKDMSVEGIFRLNGNIKKLRELTDAINKSPDRSPDFANQSAVQLAALMKKWLRELPNPLLTFGLYDLWILSQHQKSAGLRKRVLQLCYCMLPRSHRNLVEVLLYFFSWVASFAEIDEETGSKMDIHNLATVIAPNVLFAKPAAGSSPEDGIHVRGEGFFYAIEVLNQMIEQHEELSMVPHDLMTFYEKCGFDKTETLSTKEICARIDKTLKEHPKPFERTVSLLAQEDDSYDEFPEVRSNYVLRGNTQRVEQSAEGQMY
ncbi:rho-GTPase-activating protein Lrg1p [Diutina rugosa]